MIDDLTRDLGYAGRQIKDAPGFAAVAVLALALGIGATVTVFTIVNAVLLRPLPFERPDQIYRIAKKSASGADRAISVPEFDRWRTETRTVAALAGYTPMDFNLRGPNPEGLLVVWASRNFLELLGVTPQHGRGFTAIDFEPGSSRTALVSHEFWTRRYGSDPAIVGTQVDLEGPDFLSESSGRYTIVGVLPPRFWLFYSRTDFVIPMRASARQMNDPAGRLVETVIARAPDTSSRAVRADIAAIARRADLELSPASAQPAAIDVAPVRDWHFGALRRPLALLMGTALLVALTACANVAVVLIARTSYRQRELAIRAAIGAARGRLIRQLLTESLLLSLAGGVAGVLLALAGTRVVAALIPSAIIDRVPGGAASLSIDGRVLAVAASAVVAAGLLSGLGSILAVRLDGLIDRTANGLASGRPVLQSALVVAQTVIAVVLLAGAGLLLRSLSNLHRVDLGIEPRAGLVFWLNMNPSRYPQDADRVRFYTEVFDRLQSQPDIGHASGVDLPFTFEWQTTAFATAQHGRTESREWPEALARAVTPTYFERHGIRLVAGRALTARDAAGVMEVAVVSQTLAKRYWPGTSAVGQQLRTRSEDRIAAVTIVGVAADVRSAPHAEPRPIIYRPFQQAPPPWMYITVEGRTPASDLLPAIRRAVWSVDPAQPVDGTSGPWTLQEWVSDRTRQPRLIAAVANALATIALLLATIGLYGLLSYSVARRTPEFAVRMALGATRGGVLGLILRRTVFLTGAGSVLGLVTAAVITRFMESLLFGVRPFDPLTFAAAGGLFLAVSTAASLVPASRAMSVSLLNALRAE